MTNKPEDNKKVEVVKPPIVVGNANSPQQMALAAQLAEMAKAAGETVKDAAKIENNKG